MQVQHSIIRKASPITSPVPVTEMFRLFSSRVRFGVASLAIPCTGLVHSALAQGEEKPSNRFIVIGDVEKLAHTPPVPALSPNDFRSFPLVSRESLTKDTSRLVFSLRGANDELGLSVASCLVVKGPDLDEGGKPAIRPYTPVSRVHDRGYFELVVKGYPNGKVSKWLNEIPVGTYVPFKGPFSKFDYKPNQWDAVGLIAGGSGIAPMYQLLQEILNNPRDRTEVRLIFANRTPADVILKDELDALAVRFPNFKVLYTVDEVPPQEAGAWSGKTGHVTREMIASFLPPPQQDAGKHKLLVCGPPPMVAAVCGAKQGMEQGALGGILADMKYAPDQVFKY